MRYWLMKSEPSDVSIDHLAGFPNQTVNWYGVRNYAARNFMRDDMKLGDLAFFYHSSCPEPGIAGIVRISRLAYPDPTQFDPESHYFDPGSKPEAPRWFHVDVTLVRKTRLFHLQEMRDMPELADMVVLRKGNRLSITPVTETEWNVIEKKLA